MKLHIVGLHLLVWGLAFVPTAHANLTVHPMRTAVGPARGAEIRVYSQSPRGQFVRVSIKRIVAPAGTDEHEVEVEADASAFVVTPARFALAGGSNRLVRLLPLHPVHEETAYRVYIEGMRGPEDEPSTAIGDAQASLGVSLVWGALVNVLPADGEVAAEVHDGRLRNTGTLRLGIIGIADCTGMQCTPHEVARSLYPGASMALPFDVLPGHQLQLRYRLSNDGFREHTHTLEPAGP
ncbi:pilus assembly protein [Stenotrophomonas tumulicola]|uniref:Pilus assembly protein n=1 Tax=Stenotrophomonas tumulicola TaxID=1685415 RepID=A0A7W3FQQ5_9GAMM|nr:pilus assembly protein [Stenotrophomonas tumulicola]MBA8683867.1 pilus assembly protein [Stenotrophomonas tumulicola]